LGKNPSYPKNLPSYTYEMKPNQCSQTDVILGNSQQDKGRQPASPERRGSAIPLVQPSVISKKRLMKI